MIAGIEALKHAVCNQCNSVTIPRIPEFFYVTPDKPQY